MDKNELEYARIRAGADRYRETVQLIKFFIGCLACAASIWLIFEGLSKVIGNQDADGITAFAKVIEALKIGSILGYIFGAGAVAAWKVERTAKKRAIREKSRYQKLAEKADVNRTTSGLSETGDTPTEEAYHD